MWQLIGVFGFFLLFVGAIWGSWKSFTSFYDSGIFRLADDKQVAWMLIHPGWWLMPLVPIFGKAWLDGILEEALLSTSLQLPFEKPDKSGEDVNDLRGGDCVLISEYYERGSGISYAVRLIPLLRNSVFKSGFDSVDKLETNEIPVYTARYIKREWAIVQRVGDTYELRARKRDFVISVIDAGGEIATLCSSSHGHRLTSGDRFVIDITEFQFLKLPYLGLIRKTGEIVCSNIEAGYSSTSEGLSPRFIIRSGRLIAPHLEKSFYKSVKGINTESEKLRVGVLMQPGDRLTLDGGEELYLGYIWTGR